ncbi:hypothetical protein Bhyg_14380 [Pseudolycoriella hygida]|uniref:Peptidase S1 domain-containing protein n=1 Tax=Pseudolycoriella hygida TaxID=35572 RepID=A0A9Q0MRW1_9DIPT|nr:hypothetical protein Bhyg_14380 [Pseudolycoriella hygida]
MLLICARILLVSLVWTRGLGSEVTNEQTTLYTKEHPSMARVVIKNGAAVQKACLGSILSDSYILTTVHCINDDSNIKGRTSAPSQISVLIGASDTDNSNGRGETFTVSRIFTREYLPKNDFAILKLSSKISLDGVNRKAVSLDAGEDAECRNWIYETISNAPETSEASLDDLKPSFDLSAWLPFPFNIVYRILVYLLT